MTIERDLTTVVRRRRGPWTGAAVAVVAGAAALALVAGCTSSDSAGPTSSSASSGTSVSGTSGPPGSTRPAEPIVVRRGDPLARPDRYASKDGVLHLIVRAEQGPSSINGVDYLDMYQYRTEVVDGKGTFTAGTASTYVAPEWDLQPGDKLIVDYVNLLPNVEFTAVGEKEGEAVPRPLNLHTHGLTVAPAGNSDNVLLAIPQQRSNRVEIDIPADHHHGLYWYHPHVHGVADDDVYEGLAGHIVVGRADGDYRELDGLAVEPMMIRYSVVQPGGKGELIDASAYDTTGTALQPRGKMIYTTNGQVAPRITLNPADPSTGTAAESAVWAFTNITGSASYIVALDEVDEADATNPDAVGTPIDIRVVSIDGTPMPAPKVISGDAAARGYLLGQGGRVAILVDGASAPGKVVRLLQIQNRSGTGERSAYNFPEQRYGGGYRDYTRDVLAASVADAAKPGKHVDTPAVLTPNYTVTDPGLVTADVVERRTFIYNDVAEPSPQTPNNFPIDFSLFPDNATAQPRVGTVEEWTILNYSSLHHPFHMHTQFGQVMEIVSPVNPEFRDAPGAYPSLQSVTDLNQPAPAAYTQDVVNIPPALIGDDGMPSLSADGVPVEPGKVVLRLRIDDYLGTYVEHCHRLPHEDRGMMSMIRSIPNDPPVGVVRGRDAGSVVDVIGSRSGTVLATLDGAPTGPVGVAVGDADADAVPDVAIATVDAADPTKGRARVLSGASGFQTAIVDVTFAGPGPTIALSDVNGDRRDDLIVGAATGGRVRVFDSGGPTPGSVLMDFEAFPGSAGAISVAAGVLEVGGRTSIVVGAGPGGPPTVKIYNVDLFGDAEGRMPDLHARIEPLEVASFSGLGGVGDAGSTDGVNVTVGYPFAATGAFAVIGVAPRTGPVVVRTWQVTGEDPTGDGVPDHRHSDVSPSGVSRPHLYTPGGRRTVGTAGPGSFDLVAGGFGAGARLAFVSTPFGADLVVAPEQGGAPVRFTVTPALGTGAPLTGAAGAVTDLGSM